MSKTCNIIGIIHARGGSVRIPLKNIKPLNGIPLIEYSIKAGLNSRHIRRLIVSTDHRKIREIALNAGAEVPFVRPKKLSTDCPSEWVSQHAVKFVEEEENTKVDIVVSMQPTTPFIEADDIDKCIELLIENNNLTSSFTSAPITERPEGMYYYHSSDRLSKYYKDKIPGGDTKLLPKMVFPNGGAFVTRRDVLFEKSELMTEYAGTFVMPYERSVDIDNPIDFAFADFLAKEKCNEQK